MTPPVTALVHGLPDLTMPHAVAVVDSLMRLSRAHPSGTGAGAPPHESEVMRLLLQSTFGRKVLRHLDLRAESGLESIVRVLLVLAGHRVESQVTLPNGQRVDLLVDGVLALELNGRHHATPDHFLSDHEKDLVTSEARYTPARYTYHQVMNKWPKVYADILRRLARAHGVR